MKRVFAHIGFSSALTLIVLNFLPKSFHIPILGVLFSLFVMSFAFTKVRKALAVSVCIGAALFSCFVFIITYNSTVVVQNKLDDSKASSCFYIIDDGMQTDNGFSYTAKTVYIKGDNVPQNIKIKLNTSKKLQCSAYDYIISDLSFTSISDNAYNSYGYFSDKIYISAKLSNTYTVQTKDNKPVGYYILLMKNSIENVYSSVFNGDTSGLAIALMTGDKRLLSDKVTSDFINCGVSHLMAVSGLHLSVIIGSIYYILKKLKLSKKINVTITFLFMMIFDGIASFSPSVIRASIMLAVFLFGSILKRKADSLNSLGIAVFIICLNPFAICDVGTLLSITSALSLITIYPVIRKRFKSSKKSIDFILSSVGASLSVLVFTFPILWMFFGTANIISLVLNVIMIPLAEFSMVSLLILLLVSNIGIIGYIVANVSAFALFLMMQITSFVSSLNIPFIAIDSNITGIAIFCVLFITSIPFIMKKTGLLRLSSVLSVSVFIITMLLGYITDVDKTYLRMSSNSQSDSIIIYNNEGAVVIGNMAKGDYYTYKRIASSRNIDIILMIVPNSENTYYNDMLTANVKTYNYVLSDDNGMSSTQSNCQELLYSSDFEVTPMKDVTIHYVNNENGFYVISNICSKTVIINKSRIDLQSNSDVVINFSSFANGCYGDEYTIYKTDFEDSRDVLFEFRGNRQIIARRESLWLK